MRISDYATMSFSISDDLLCTEDSNSLSTIFDSQPPFTDDESIAGLIQDESNFVDQLPELPLIPLDSSARRKSVSWILKVRAYYNFDALTAYLAVNYLDRFLSSYRLPQSNGWTLQLLAVACLSLAAKMEESLVPALHQFQVEGAKFIFRPRTIQRMELLVLGVLHWRLRTVTPFSFISFLAHKADPTRTSMTFLTLRSTEIILSILQEASLLEYRPSSIAAAAVLCAASEIPKLSLVAAEDAESWCHGISKEEVLDCYKLMQHVMIGKAMNTDRTSSCSVSDCTPSVCSSSSSTYTFENTSAKRRRLNSCSLVDLDYDELKYGSN